MRGYVSNLKVNAENMTSELTVTRKIIESEEYDPKLLPDGELAAGIILDSISKDLPILIYGDYDCDGIMSTSIMYKYLSHRTSNLSYYIPDRFNEGYGMNIERLKKIVEEGKVKTIITVDNGISAVEQTKFLKDNGIRVVITDHHTCPQVLPDAEAIVNCHLSTSKYPYNDLCGAGVAYKLISLIESMSPSTYDDFDELKDMAAVATIADVVPLTGENRAIVKERLPLLSKTRSRGINAIIGTSSSLYGITNLTAENVAFSISPLINSASRMGNVDVAIKLMLADTTERAIELAQRLHGMNTARKIEEERITSLAINSVITIPSIDCDYPIIVYGKEWNLGVIGIVAARIAEKFHVPAFVCALTADGILHGSARTYGSFNVINALTDAANTLCSFGGHPGAGGFSLPLSNFADFKSSVMESYFDYIFNSESEPLTEADAELSLEGISVEAIQSLSDTLGPYGEANKEPVFITDNLTVIKASAIGKDKGTLKMVVKDEGGHLLNCIGFNMGFYSSILVEGDKIAMAYRLKINEYNGQCSAQACIKDIDSSRVGELSDALNEIWPDVYNSYRTLQFSFADRKDAPQKLEYIESFPAIISLAENMTKKGKITLEEATLWINRMSGLSLSTIKTLIIFSVIAESKNLAVRVNRNKCLFFAKCEPNEKVEKLSSTKLYRLLNKRMEDDKYGTKT